MDDLLFGKHRERLMDRIKTLPEQLPQIPPLISDTFCAFYKLHPKFLDDSQIAPEFLVNKCVLAKMMKTDAFSELKESTTLDDINSAIAATIFVEKLYDELKRELEKMREHTEAIQKLRSELKNCSGEQLPLVHNLHASLFTGGFKKSFKHSPQPKKNSCIIHFSRSFSWSGLLAFIRDVEQT